MLSGIVNGPPPRHYLNVQPLEQHGMPGREAGHGPRLQTGMALAQHGEGLTRAVLVVEERIVEVEEDGLKPQTHWDAGMIM